MIKRPIKKLISMLLCISLMLGTVDLISDIEINAFEMINHRTVNTVDNDDISHTDDSEADTDVSYVGDVDGDGKITPKDVTMLRRCLAGGWDVDVVKEEGDVDGDGKITPKDVTMLRRYLAGGWGVKLPVKENKYPEHIDSLEDLIDINEEPLLGEGEWVVFDQSILETRTGIAPDYIPIYQIELKDDKEVVNKKIMIEFDYASNGRSVVDYIEYDDQGKVISERFIDNYNPNMVYDGGYDEYIYFSPLQEELCTISWLFYEYDEDDRLVKTTHTNADRTILWEETYTYDEVGKIIGKARTQLYEEDVYRYKMEDGFITDIYTLDYDENGRLLKETNYTLEHDYKTGRPLKDKYYCRCFCLYDENGRISRYENKNSSLYNKIYSYSDESNQLLVEPYKSETEKPNEKWIYTSDRDKIVTNYRYLGESSYDSYDEGYTVTSKYGSDGKLIEYKYENFICRYEQSSREKIYYQYNTTSTRKIYRQYDEKGLIKECISYEYEDSKDKENSSVVYYEKSGDIVDKLQYNEDRAIGYNKAGVSSYKFDKNGRLIEAGDYKYEYDSHGNLIKKLGISYEGMPCVEGECERTYDDNGRLIGSAILNEDKTIIYAERYEYDENGNRTIVPVPIEKKSTEDGKGIVERYYGYYLNEFTYYYDSDGVITKIVDDEGSIIFERELNEDGTAKKQIVSEYKTISMRGMFVQEAGFKNAVTLNIKVFDEEGRPLYSNGAAYHYEETVSPEGFKVISSYHDYGNTYDENFRYKLFREDYYDEDQIVKTVCFGDDVDRLYLSEEYWCDEQGDYYRNGTLCFINAKTQYFNEKGNVAKIVHQYEYDRGSGEIVYEPDENGDMKIVERKRAITEISIPDEIFRTYVLDNYDTDKDGYLSNEEINPVTEIDCSGMQISDIRGIGLFENLVRIDCSNNSITKIDLKMFKRDMEIVCDEGVEIKRWDYWKDED